MVDTGPLWTLSAHELALAYAAGTSPREVIEATLSHIDEVNPRLNAVITLDAPGALAAADASGRRWRDGKPASPLDGVPITVKDNILVAGLRATWGSKLYRDFVPDEDELPVRRMREAGAVILGKTNVPEFTVHGYTDNMLFGTTGNPWNPALTPGGSSGGAVAAVASGMCTLALGTDGGGSIRRPAAHTGLVGFKPSRDTVPRGKGFPAILGGFEVIGPIARCVGDIIRSMDVIGGPEWRATLEESALPRPRIAYAPTFGDAPVEPVIRDAIERAVAQARALGLDIETLSSFTLADPLAEIWPVISQTGVAWLLDQHHDWKDKVAPAIAEMAAAGSKHSARDYLDALDRVAGLQRSFDAFFTQYDFLLTPAAAAMPWPAGEPHPTAIDGCTVGPRGHAVFTPIANALGLPAMSLPCIVDDGALPVGLQLIAARDRDRRLLNFASAQEGRLFAHRWPEALG
ncbi:amidase [Bradyrhizobium commune]|uniref:Amidase n=1 Tax=Bradyrhizobium commune TaxID=83627 RepID=A0A7S9D187_9BRAD|nr:amidase [Bradyrhizobium commune]QPF89304.1 amidase [Bradyrhizobium commune]